MGIWREVVSAQDCNAQELEQIVDLLLAKNNLKAVRVEKIEHGEYSRNVRMELVDRKVVIQSGETEE